MGKAESMGCEMADRPVVARKSEPMKAGDSMEGKTRMSVRRVAQPASASKGRKTEAKGTCFVKVCE